MALCWYRYNARKLRTDGYRPALPHEKSREQDAHGLCLFWTDSWYESPQNKNRGHCARGQVPLKTDLNGEQAQYDKASSIACAFEACQEPLNGSSVSLSVENQTRRRGFNTRVTAASSPEAETNKTMPRLCPWGLILGGGRFDNWRNITDPSTRITRPEPLDYQDGISIIRRGLMTSHY